jgi:hypothetical protein
VSADGFGTSPSAMASYKRSSNALSRSGVSAIRSLHIGQDGTPRLIHVNKHQWQKVCMHSGLFSVNNIFAGRPELT